MGRLDQVTGDEHGTSVPSPLLASSVLVSPLLTSRRHIDLLRVSSALGALR